MKLTEKVKSNMQLHSVTLDEVNSSFMFSLKNKHSSVKECDLVKKMINAYFGTVITFEKSKDSQNDSKKFIREIINKKQYLKLKTDPNFLKNVTDILSKLKRQLFVEKRILEISDDYADLDDIIEWE